MPDSMTLKLRTQLHRKICKNLLGLRKKGKKRINYLSCADGGSAISIELAFLMLKHMNLEPCKKPKAGQTVGKLFAKYIMEFLQEVFKHIHHLRPGEWMFSASQAKPGIAAFDQYEHLSKLQAVLNSTPGLAAALGGDYLITPDIVIGRKPVNEKTINAVRRIVSESSEEARLTPLRAINRKKPKIILHASISCKWSMRSDRAQNTRTEALNLIRNRKGKTPLICAVTLEPLPTRLASIAMGTGDVDCTYHVALKELILATKEAKSESQREMLKELVDGRRLRDISDLPFDLAL